MTTQTRTRQAMKTLLTPKEVIMCKQIAAGNNKYSQRAAALLTIHAGATHAQAASETDLSIGQVKYCVTRFHQLRLACFPDSATAQPEQPEAEAKTIVSKSKPEKNKKKDKQKAKDKSKDKKKGKDKKKDKDKEKANKDKKGKKKK